MDEVTFEVIASMAVDRVMTGRHYSTRQIHGEGLSQRLRLR
jgi:hypothetical protein